MKLLVIPTLSLLIGGGAGIGAGTFMKPKVDPVVDVVASNLAETVDDRPQKTEDVGVEYANLSNQFIVPIVTNGQVESIVVLSIALEVIEGSLEDVLKSEPKLRAAFLQVFFNHSNNGGFSRNFTSFSAMDSLKRELLLVAQSIIADVVTDVLILDIIRQQA